MESQYQPPLDNPNITSNNPQESSESEDTTCLFKIVLIGDSNSGKTSLIRRYVKNTFAENYYCTIAVDFFLKEVTVQNKKIKLQIWDTAGMEKYKSVTASYIRGSYAAFIVFDLTEQATFDNLTKWIDLYHKNSNSEYKKNIILIGNKVDLDDKRQVSQREVEDFAKSNDLTYFETSAKTGNNVEEAFTYIGNHLYSNFGNIFENNLSSTNFLKENKSEDLVKKQESKCC